MAQIIVETFLMCVFEFAFTISKGDVVFNLHGKCVGVEKQNRSTRPEISIVVLQRFDFILLKSHHRKPHIEEDVICGELFGNFKLMENLVEVRVRVAAVGQLDPFGHCVEDNHRRRSDGKQPSKRTLKL